MPRSSLLLAGGVVLQAATLAGGVLTVPDVLGGSVLQAAPAPVLESACGTFTVGWQRQHRECMVGEPSPEDGYDEMPVHIATVSNLSAVITQLADASPTLGMHHKVLLTELGCNGPCVTDVGPFFTVPVSRNMSGTTGVVGFMIWLPAGFSQRSTPWPTVVFLHGRHEAAFDDPSATLAKVVHHGLPHRIAERSPFNEEFVLISPQLLSPDPVQLAWSHYLPLLESMRNALFSDTRLDPERATLTGISLGAVGVLGWAGFNPNMIQPWAAIVPISGRWPVEQSLTDSRPFTMIEHNIAALQRLSTIPTWMIACANDRVNPIYLGARGRARCLHCQEPGGPNSTERDTSMTSAANDSAKCQVGADAIFETLHEMGKSDLWTYDRRSYCPAVHLPTDTSFVPMFDCTMANTGHDGWTAHYASREFVDWILDQRLAPTHRWW